MKVAWADIRNQNKCLFIDKTKHKDGVTVTVKLACDKDIVAAAEIKIKWENNTSRG